jgi:RecB family exonuclease|tara:strand:- start:742 stop:1413 length:672 start_codon:yes stop_codon:yes gene_type:complete
MNAAPWSFSKIKAFQQCPKQFYHEKVIKQYPFKMTEAIRYGDQFHKAAEKYIRDGEELPKRFLYAKDSLDALKRKRGDKLCEYRMGLTEDLEPCGFYEDNVWWRGIADLIILNQDQGLAYVVDYKTGKSSRYADKGQLELMAMATFKHFPNVDTVRAGLLFVVCEDLVRSTYEQYEADTLWDKWMDNFQTMETAYKVDVWNPKPSGLCRQWCQVMECPHNGRR